jgi:hypothetical protein
MAPICIYVKNPPPLGWGDPGTPPLGTFQDLLPATNSYSQHMWISNNGQNAIWGARDYYPCYKTNNYFLGTSTIDPGQRYFFSTAATQDAQTIIKLVNINPEGSWGPYVVQSTNGGTTWGTPVVWWSTASSGKFKVSTDFSKFLLVGNGIKYYTGSDPMNGTWTTSNPPGFSGTMAITPSNADKTSWICSPGNGGFSNQIYEATWSGNTLNWTYIGSIPGVTEIRGVCCRNDVIIMATWGGACKIYKSSKTNWNPYVICDMPSDSLVSGLGCDATATYIYGSGMYTSGANTYDCVFASYNGGQGWVRAHTKSNTTSFGGMTPNFEDLCVEISEDGRYALIGGYGGMIVRKY